MIALIKGILLEKKPPHILVEVAGIGYEVQVSMQSFYHLPNVGSDVFLHTHLTVREDGQFLYGFVTKGERSLFRALIKVAGIGPKSALTILSSVEPREFVRYVLEDDVSRLVQLPGIGKKTAQRLIIEMRDKFANCEIFDISHEFGPTNVSNQGVKGESEASELGDAISALVSLGYKPQDARNAILKHKKGGDVAVSSADLIKAVLKGS